MQRANSEFALAERSATHAVAAQAEASLRAARELFYAAIEAAWAAAHEDEPVPVPLRNDLRLAATYDPAVLTGLKVQGVAPDVALARKWYEHARALGSPEAADALARLGG